MIAELGLYCIPYLWLSWCKQLCCEAFPRQVLSRQKPFYPLMRRDGNSDIARRSESFACHSGRRIGLSEVG